MRATTERSIAHGKTRSSDDEVLDLIFRTNKARVEYDARFFYDLRYQKHRAVRSADGSYFSIALS